MSAGLVVNIRVNPADVMGVIDTLDHLGIPKDNLSFAQATKLVLASALESFRQEGIIPRREGFEYSKMLEPFEMQSYASRAAKLRVAKQLSQPPIEKPNVFDDRKAARFEELIFKQKQDPLNMSDEETTELANLLAQVQ